MKKVLLLFLFLTYGLLEGRFDPGIPCKACILINMDTGKILYEKNKEEKLPIASLTKIATALTVAHYYDGNFYDQILVPKKCLIHQPEKVKIAKRFIDPPYWLEPDGSNFQLKPNQRLSLYNLLQGCLIRSANDAANVVAYATSGSIPGFMQQMNDLVRELGCQDSHFVNPHGLFHPKHYSTAYDLAILGQAAYRIPLIRIITGSTQCEQEKTHDIHRNPNFLLRKGKYYYPPAVGLKTGYNRKAGYCLIAIAIKDGRSLLSVFLGCENRFDRFLGATRLFEQAFSEQKETRLLYHGNEVLFQKEIEGAKQDLLMQVAQDVSIQYYPSEEPDFEVEYTLDSLSLPIKQNHKVGTLILYEKSSKQILRTEPLYAFREVTPERMYLFKKFFVVHPFLFSLIVSLGILLSCYSFLRFKTVFSKKKVK